MHAFVQLLLSQCYFLVVTYQLIEISQHWNNTFVYVVLVKLCERLVKFNMNII